MKTLYRLRGLFLLVTFLAFSQTLLADTYYGPSRVTFTYDYLKGTIDMQYLELDEAGLDDELDRITIWYYDNTGRLQLLIDNGYNLAQWGGSINHPDISYVNAPTDDDLRYRKFRWNKIPTSLLGKNVNFLVEYDWDIDDNDHPSGAYDGEFIKRVNAFSIARPSNVFATDNDCSEVTITWSNPSLLDAPATNYEVAIYRNDVALTSVPLKGSPVEYIDRSVEAGKFYAYKVEAILHAGKSVHRVSSYNEFGNSRAEPKSAMTIDLSEDGCAGEVVVRWTIANNSAVSKFVIDRSTTNNFSGAVSSDASPTARFYRDAVSGNTKYFYRVRALNDCPDPKGTFITGEIEPNYVTEVRAMTDIVAQTDGSLKLTWPSPCFTTSERFLKRTSTVNNIQNEITIDLTNSAIEYTDKEVLPCVSYSYKLVLKQSSNNALHISPPLVGYISEDIKDAIVSFDASKGYFPDKVTLEWTTIKENLLTSYKIFRRLYGTTTYKLVTSIKDGSLNWVDETTEANKYYEYQLVATSSCVDLELLSDEMTTVGFRQPRGTVAGQITYEGGTAVQGVKVLANSNEAGLAQGTSLEMFGTSYLQGQVETNADFSEGFTVEGWYNFRSHPFYTNLFRFDGPFIFAFITPTTNVFDPTSPPSDDPGQIWFHVGRAGIEAQGEDPTERFVDILKYDLKVDPEQLVNQDGWNHISLNYNRDSTKIFINGEVATKVKSFDIVSEADGDFSISFADWLDGHVDEVRVWNRSLTDEETKRFYKMVTSGTEPGLVINYHFDEGVGAFAFDASRGPNGFNGNHSKIEHSETDAGGNPGGIFPQFSSDILDSDLLSRHAFTDETGSYIINGLPYRNTGEQYRVTPIFGQHTFDPSSKTRFIGDGSYVHNDVDFTDISSFLVTGRVTYKDTDFPVEDVLIKIDGRIAVGRDNQPITTNSSGDFRVSVPIGDHFISVEKIGHVFNEDRFPKGVDSLGLPNTFSFNEGITGMTFFDDTKVLLTGRIVGGTKEGNKKIGFDLSKNNIGPATAKLVPVKPYFLKQGTTNNNFIEFTNDPVTGEYQEWIIPEEFNVESVTHSNYSFSQPHYLAKIDLKNALTYITETDSVFQTTVESGNIVTTFDSIRTFQYHHRRDWIYRAPPTIEVTSNGSDWLSDKEFTYTNQQSETCVIPLETAGGENLFDYPVFTQLKQYPWRIKIFEQYINSDTDAISSVDVTDAKITVSNNLSENTTPIVLETNEKGIANYSFKGGFPNTSLNTTSPGLSFTQSASIVAKTGTGEIANWPSTGVYRAYLMGGFPTGNNFITTGPNKVDFILRDPPGSNSFATLEKGATTTKTTTTTVVNGNEGEETVTVNWGADFETQTGTPFLYITNKIETENSAGVTAEHTEGWTDENTFSQSTTFTESFSTSDSPDFVGADGDVFIGHSTNIVYGLSSDLTIAMPSDIPIGGARLTTEQSAAGKTLTIGVRKSVRVNPAFNTFFVFSQRQIKDNIIPNIRILRNLLFTNHSDRYAPIFNDTNDPKFGTNNDDKVWGDQAASDPVVHNGPSYSFTPYNVTDPDWTQDSVRFYNIQIANWEQILANNERQKLQGSPNNRHSNISFDAGVVFTGSVEESKDTTEIDIFEWTLNPGLVVETGLTVNGVGPKLELVEKYTHGETEFNEVTTSTSKTVEFTLLDQDESNYYTVDVFDCNSSNGPIFRTKGGQSSCPYEGDLRTEYFQPGSLLNQATVRIENPKITADAAFMEGVPETQPAVFTLSLSNPTDATVDRWFLLRQNNASNPFGAKLFVDGSPLSSSGITVFIPNGQSITKTLEVFKGAPSVNEYRDLIIELLPVCDTDDIVDQAVIGVNYVPACSSVNIAVPANNWISNVENNNEMNIELDGYNVNLSSFRYIALQVKDVASPNWTTLITYYKTQTDLDADMSEAELVGTRTSIDYVWNTKDYVDRNYELRALSVCVDGSIFESNRAVGIKDTKRPGPFGAPQPSDGVLSAGDEVIIQFDEEIISGLLLANRQFVTARGVLNGTDFPNNTSISFDGVDDNAIVGDGIILSNTSFTVEAWVRHNDGQAGTFWSLGETAENQLKLGFDASGKIIFTDGSTTYTGTRTYDNGKWYHIGLTYDEDGQGITLYQDTELDINTTGTVTSLPTGRMSFGYDLATGSQHFNGRIRDFRIWNRAIPFDIFFARKSASLSGNEPGLLGYWFMGEKFGNIAHDKSHLRHATLNATWSVEPTGSSMSFSGSSYLQLDGRSIDVNNETDFTIELWFNGQPGGEQTLISSGRGTSDELFNADQSFAITASSSGIEAISNGKTLQLTSDNLLDNTWHHLALVVNRRGSARAFIDGAATNQVNVAGFGGVGVDYIYLGARRWQTGASTYDMDRHFNGLIDEVRIWKSARTADQIEMYKNHRVAADEIGLTGYYPFETYELDNFNVLMLNPTLEDQWPGDDQFLNGEIATPNGGAAFSTITPNIGLLRPVKNLNFDLVVNDDRVLININEPLSSIEGTFLEFSIRDVFDLRNNRLASAVHWSAFVDKNQLKWEESSLKMENEFGTQGEFNASIRNFGGTAQSYFIDNLPPWLIATPSSGTLNALASTEITFTINEALNPGSYAQDIYLVSENGVNERFALDLKIFKQGPDWAVAPENYEFSMSVIGILKINNLISRNPNDMVAVFKDGQVRGVTKLLYVQQKDQYMVFLDIYGDASDNNSELEVKVWNENIGQINTGATIFDGTTTSDFITFEAGQFLGSTEVPAEIRVGNEQEQSVPLLAGWNWISLNLESPDQSSTNVLFKTIEATEGDIIKSQDGPSAIYDPVIKWFGQLDEAGFDNVSMYLMKLASKDTLVYNGTPLNPSTTPITLNEKWNWIGYIPNFALPVAEALANHAPVPNDVIKGQRGFAIYDNGLQTWIGSLKNLNPSAGYKYYSNATSDKTFTYPNVSSFGLRSEEPEEDLSKNFNVDFAAFESSMNVIVKLEGFDDYSENAKVIALHDGKQVGFAEPLNVHSEVLYFLTIYGNYDPYDVSFSLLFEKSGEEFQAEQQMAYAPEQIIGNLKAPFILSKSIETEEEEEETVIENLLKVWPSPYNESLNISMYMEYSSEVRISMYDITGRDLGQIYNGFHDQGNVTISIDEKSNKVFNQTAGVYMLRIDTGIEVNTLVIVKQ